MQSQTISTFKSQTFCRSYGDETEEKPCGAETGGVHLTVAGWHLGLGMKGKNHLVLYIPSPADRVKVEAIFLLKIWLLAKISFRSSLNACRLTFAPEK